MKKISIIVLVTAGMAIASCKKNNTAHTTPAESMKNTVWGGYYFDYTNTAVNRAYTITLNADYSFDWSARNPVQVFTGTWKVTGKIISFKFSSGAKNEWMGEVSGNELQNITEPVPATFRFVNCMKNP
jgi:hypothetical protein